MAVAEQPERLSFRLKIGVVAIFLAINGFLTGREAMVENKLLWLIILSLTSVALIYAVLTVFDPRHMYYVLRVMSDPAEMPNWHLDFQIAINVVINVCLVINFVLTLMEAVENKLLLLWFIFSFNALAFAGVLLAMLDLLVLRTHGLV